MKNICICIMLLGLAVPSFCQQTKPPKPLTREEYLAKSKTQKVFGFLLLGAGATTLLIISKGNTNLDAVGPLAVIGGVSTLGSIPLFIASGRNKRKALQASASLNFFKNQPVKISVKDFQPAPAISVKVNL